MTRFYNLLGGLTISDRTPLFLISPILRLQIWMRNAGLVSHDR